MVKKKMDKKNSRNILIGVGVVVLLLVLGLNYGGYDSNSLTGELGSASLGGESEYARGYYDGFYGLGDSGDDSGDISSDDSFLDTAFAFGGSLLGDDTETSDDGNLEGTSCTTFGAQCGTGDVCGGYVCDGLYCVAVLPAAGQGDSCLFNQDCECFDSSYGCRSTVCEQLCSTDDDCDRGICSVTGICVPCTNNDQCGNDDSSYCSAGICDTCPSGETYFDNEDGPDGSCCPSGTEGYSNLYGCYSCKTNNDNAPGEDCYNDHPGVNMWECCDLTFSFCTTDAFSGYTGCAGVGEV